MAHAHRLNSVTILGPSFKKLPIAATPFYAGRGFESVFPLSSSIHIPTEPGVFTFEGLRRHVGLNQQQDGVADVP